MKTTTRFISTMLMLLMAFSCTMTARAIDAGALDSELEAAAAEQPNATVIEEPPVATPTVLTPAIGNDGHQPLMQPMNTMLMAVSGSWTEFGLPGHSSASGDTVAFSGQPKDPFTSLLFRAATDGDYRILTFHLTEGTCDWHTLEGSGFIFNAGISNGSLSGYAVLFSQSNVGYYKLTNVSVAGLASATFTHNAGVTLIDQKPKPAYSTGTTWILKLVMSPGTMKFERYSDPGYTQLAETIFNVTSNDTSAGSGYGPFGSFLAHDCPSISTSSLEYFNLEIKPNSPPVLSAPDVTMYRGDAFAVMDGVSANDAEDGNLTSSVTVVSSNVNAQIPGKYQVTYAVHDLAGASISHTRNVTVLADVLFHVVDAKSKAAIPGVGATLDGSLPATSGQDGKCPAPRN